MSIAVMSLAWYVGDVSPAQKAVLVALADHADEDGNRVYPAVDRLCLKTSYAERTVRRALSDLREMGLIHIVREATRYRPTEYRIDLPQMQARQNRPPAGVPEMHPSASAGVPENTAGVPESPRRGARNAPKPSVDPPIDPPEEARAPRLHDSPVEPNGPDQPEPRTIPARNGASKKTRIQSPHIPRDTHFENGFIPPGAGQNPVQVYYERFEIHKDDARLNAIQEDDLTHKCPDLERLREVVTAYSRTSYRERNIELILDWYHGGVPKRTPNSINGASNGTYRRSNGFGRDAEARDPEPEFIPDAEFLAQMERFNARRAGRAVAGS